MLNLRRHWSTFFYVLRDRTNWREGRIWRHAFCDPMFLIIFVLITKDSPAFWNLVLVLVLLLALLCHYHTSELINTSVSSFWVGVQLFRHHTYVSAECVTVPKWELQNGVEDLIPVKCSCLVSTRRTCEISLVSREPEYIPVVLRCVRCGLYLCYGCLAKQSDL